MSDQTYSFTEQLLMKAGAERYHLLRQDRYDREQRLERLLREGARLSTVDVQDMSSDWLMKESLRRLVNQDERPRFHSLQSDALRAAGVAIICGSDADWEAVKALLEHLKSRSESR